MFVSTQRRATFTRSLPANGEAAEAALRSKPTSITEEVCITLIELLVVIAIIGIMAALLLPAKLAANAGTTNQPHPETWKEK